MDYNEFKKELRDYTEWEKDGLPYIPLLGSNRKSVLQVDNDGNFYHPEAQNDLVNSPAHYTRGSQECIDTIEEAIQDAPDVKSGMLQAQALKYLLRLWLKGNAPQDSAKARWYLERLIKHLGETE
tara:strand:- start:9 stop:383 length:375 start_codon:yes stop_codon:yes gene_type:complete